MWQAAAVNAPRQHRAWPAGGPRGWSRAGEGETAEGDREETGRVVQRLRDPTENLGFDLEGGGSPERRRAGKGRPDGPLMGALSRQLWGGGRRL